MPELKANKLFEKLEVGDFVKVVPRETRPAWGNNKEKYGVVHDVSGNSYAVKGVGAWFDRDEVILIHKVDKSIPADESLWDEYKKPNDIWKE